MLLGKLAKEIKDSEIVIVQRKMANLEVWPIILVHIRKAQEEDEYLAKAQKFEEETKKGQYTIASNGTVRFKGRINVPKMVELRIQLLKEAHETPYSVHPGTTKMYKDLKKGYQYASECNSRFILAAPRFFTVSSERFPRMFSPSFYLLRA